jgi:hypothetical protein
MGEGSANNSPRGRSKSPSFKPFSATWRNDWRWLWGPRTVNMCSNSLGNCDYMLSLTTGSAQALAPAFSQHCDIVYKSVVLQWDVHTT